MDVIRVAAGSDVKALAGCIAGVIRQEGRAELQAIGAAAVNQATKAVAVARGFLEMDGIDAVMVPTFTKVEIGDLERTAIRFAVERR